MKKEVKIIKYHDIHGFISNQRIEKFVSRKEARKWLNSQSSPCYIKEEIIVKKEIIN